jgi:acyl-CoA synthetase (AMP-forming)/AMP-acid ligase II
LRPAQTAAREPPPTRPWSLTSTGSRDTVEPVTNTQRVARTSSLRLDITVGAMLDEAAGAFGNTEAWVFENERVSYEDMRRRTMEAARALAASGVDKGDVVATWMPNLAEFAVLQMACARIGAIIAPLNTRFRAEEARYVLDHGDARVLVYTPSFLNIDFRRLVQEAVSARERTTPPPLLVEIGKAAPDGILAWPDFLARSAMVEQATVDAAQAELDPGEPLMLQYTSGTTAFPKGALLNHTFVLNYGAELFARQGVRAGEAIMNTQPFYHSGGACGQLPLPLTLHCVVVTPEYYEPERVLRLIERERCVARSGFAAMYLMEMAHPRFGDYDLSSVRAGWCAGPPDVLKRVRESMGIEGLIQLYASTEAGGTCGSVDEPWETRIGSHGRPFSGTEVMIADPVTTSPLPVGETGKIWCRGWCRMNGYLGQPEETAKVVRDDGWVTSHDLGFLDADGYLHYVGRVKDMLKPGGENVSAEEIEAYLMRHRDIRQVAVIGLPDARLSEAVVAVVEAQPSAVLTERDVIDFCRGKIANYKVPKRVIFTDDWPMTGSGKIQKFELRERYLHSEVP